jgi:hypothetical protein
VLSQHHFQEYEVVTWWLQGLSEISSGHPYFGFCLRGLTAIVRFKMVVSFAILAIVHLQMLFHISVQNIHSVLACLTGILTLFRPSLGIGVHTAVNTPEPPDRCALNPLPADSILDEMSAIKHHYNTTSPPKFYRIAVQLCSGEQTARNSTYSCF